MNFWQHTYSTKKKTCFFFFFGLVVFIAHILDGCASFSLKFNTQLNSILYVQLLLKEIGYLSIKKPFPTPTPINVRTVKFKFHGLCFLFKAPFVFYKTASFSKINISYDCS